MRRGDLIGGDVVAQLGIIGGVLRVPGQVFAGQLAPDQCRVFRKEQDASGQLDLGGTLRDGAVQEWIRHT